MQMTEQEKRESIGSELADILLRQKAIVDSNNALNLLDASTRSELREMAEEDERNYRMLETVITNYGMRVEPKLAAVQLSEAMSEIIRGGAHSPLEKLGVYTLLKQNQMMGSHLVHKSVQVSLPDIKLALAPFDGVYATFTRHVTTLTQLMEKAGVEWITGEQAESGLFGRARDALSTVAGMVMSKAAKPADEMSVLSLLAMDHRKVDVLFQEIFKNADPEKDAGLFHQLKGDLTAHSLAEEDTVYKAFKRVEGLREQLSDSQQEHEDIRSFLDEISDAMEDRELFLDKLDDLQQMVKHHVAEEETKVFPLIMKNSDEATRVQLAEAFSLEKKKIQENVGSDEIIASAADKDAERSSTHAAP